jgi:hypothetical protein
MARSYPPEFRRKVLDLVMAGIERPSMACLSTRSPALRAGDASDLRPTQQRPSTPRTHVTLLPI